MRILIGFSSLILSCIVASSAIAACSSSKLGTSRTIEVDTSKFRKIRGTEKSFGLRPKEVILTFDDGPIAGKTSRILKALKKECVKATFFYVGRMAQAYPRLVRRVVADGHTLAHHTHNHNNLQKYSTAGGSTKIERGISALQKIAYGDPSSVPRTPFFRYPYLARSKRTDRILARKGLIAFDANIDSLDWKKVSANKVHNRIMRRLRQEGKGIILMHDIQGRTAKMLPRLLRSLKEEGYKVVHMVAKGFAKPASEELVVASVEERKVAEDVALDKKAVERAAQLKKLAKALRVASIDEEADSEIKAIVIKQNTRRTGVQVTAAAAKSLAAVKVKRPRKLARKKKASRKKRRNFVVLAGGKKIGQAGKSKGGWKLRSSQWILN